MNQTFPLQKGEIVFESDKIRITDEARRHHHYPLISSGIWIVYGTVSVLRYLKTGDTFLLWTGLLVGGAHLVLFILFLLRSHQSEILLEDIQSMKVRKQFRRTFLDIRLKNKRLRRVVGVENASELEQFVQSIGYLRI